MRIPANGGLADLTPTEVDVVLTLPAGTVPVLQTLLRVSMITRSGWQGVNMGASVHGLDELHALLLPRLGLDAVPPALVEATTSLLNADDQAALLSAVGRYRAVLVEVAGGEAALAQHLRGIVVGPVAFLGPVAGAVTGRVVDQARGADAEVRAGFVIGPARGEVTAPAARAQLGPARKVLGHLQPDGFAAVFAAGPLRAAGAGFLHPREGSAGAFLTGDLGAVKAATALLFQARNDALSVVGLLRAEFRPSGIQLGLGFSLDAVGGLVGVDRRADTDALRVRLADGSAADVLFGGTLTSPDDVRHTVDALDGLFPHAAGSVIVGPTLRLGWLTVGSWTLARAEVGVLVELPRGRVVVPGRLVVEVPGPGVPLVHLRLDVLGEVDVAGRRLALDAALVDSTVLGALRVSGTAAVRLCWGDPPMALVTVGGFYPGFDTRPAVVPPQRRVAIDLASPIPAGLSIHAEGYVAAGAGTLQLGGRLDVAFEVAGTGVRGSVGVDALAQLSPLWFTATVTGSASLRALGRRLAGVDVRGRLTGPGPLVLHARATAEILGVDVGGSASFTLSSAGGADRTAAPLLRDAVERQLRNPANVRAEGGADPYVLVTPRDPEPGVPLVAPGAAVVWSQEAFPLGEPVEKADGRLLGRRATVLVTAGPTPTPTVTCRLPTAAFLDLTDAEVLSVPQFDERPAGLRIAAATHEGGPPHTVSTDYDTIRIPQPHTWLTSEFLYSGAVVEALRGTARPPALTAGIRPVVTVASESWAVVTNGAIDQEARSGASAHAIATRTPGATALPMAAAQAVIP